MGLRTDLTILMPFREGIILGFVYQRNNVIANSPDHPDAC